MFFFSFFLRFVCLSPRMHMRQKFQYQKKNLEKKNKFDTHKYATKWKQLESRAHRTSNLHLTLFSISRILIYNFYNKNGTPFNCKCHRKHNPNNLGGYIREIGMLNDFSDVWIGRQVAWKFEQNKKSNVKIPLLNPGDNAFLLFILLPDEFGISVYPRCFFCYTHFFLLELSNNHMVLCLKEKNLGCFIFSFDFNNLLFFWIII